MNIEVAPFESFRWFLQSERRLSGHTVSGYLSDLERWTQAGLSLKEDAAPPSPQQMREALKAFEKKAPRSSTLARRSAALRMYCRFRSLQDPTWNELLNEIPESRGEPPWPKALDLEEVETLLDFDPGRDPEMLRNRALLELLYASGLRVSEAIALEMGAVFLPQGLVRIVGKGSKERMVPFSTRAGKWLKSYLEGPRVEWAAQAPRSASSYVFLSRRLKPLTRMAVWKILHRRALLCSLEGVHPHVLRHSFATHLLKGGADIRFVQALLGHASLSTTERYIRIADEELLELFRRCHPLP